MLTWIKLGCRNLLQNKRRSLVTLGAIAFGFAAINLLGGFTDYIFRGLEDTYIYAHSYGHLSIFKKGYLDKGALDPTRYLLNEKDLATILALCRQEQRVVIATPQLNLTGLVSNGKVSTIMIAEGKDPAAINRIQGLARGFTTKLKLFNGSPFADNAFAEAGISQGLADKLDLSLASNMIIMTSTVDGFMNALDTRVIMTYDAALDILNDLSVTVPLAFAQTLVDTKGAGRVNILLQESRQVAAVSKVLAKACENSGLAVEIRSWQELQPSYLRIRNMFNVIFSFVFLIVLTIVALSVVNTVSMAVMERIREIGTLRALGLKRGGVIRIFAIESGILAGLGSLGGLLLTLGVWVAVASFKPTWMPPNIPKEVPLEIHLVPGFLILTTISMIGLAAIAAVIPARRAAALRIIDALGHI